MLFFIILIEPYLIDVYRLVCSEMRDKLVKEKEELMKQLAEGEDKHKVTFLGQRALKTV